jgi:hypothetical protein
MLSQLLQLAGGACQESAVLQQAIQTASQNVDCNIEAIWSRKTVTIRPLCTEIHHALCGEAKETVSPILRLTGAKATPARNYTEDKHQY